MKALLGPFTAFPTVYGRLLCSRRLERSWRGFQPLHRLYYSSLARRTTLMAQFESVKKQYQDYILLFQVGDFYEIYGDDASLVSTKTNLRLTKKKNIFMCGFPVKSLNEWQKTLVQAGFQLALCDQATPGKGRSKNGLLDRDVVRLITPGTLIEPLHDEANYLLSIATSSSSTAGLAWADISTADIKVTSVELESIDADLERISPSEVLLPDTLVDSVREGLTLLPSHPDHVTLKRLSKSSLLKECHLTGVPCAWYQRQEEGEGILFRPDSSSKKRKFQGQFSQLENSATCALLKYICHTQREVKPHLSTPTLFAQGHHMTIDANTRRALELVTPLQANTKKVTLLGCLDKTVTAAGGRLLKTRLSSPLTDKGTIKRRLDAVEVFFADQFHSEAVVHMLRNCEDMERIMQKVMIGSCTITDLQAIRITLHTAGAILDYLRSNFTRCDLLRDELEGLRHFDELVEVLESALSGEKYGDYIIEGYSSEVDTLRDKMLHNQQRTEQLVEQLRARLGLGRVVVASHKTFFRVLELSKTQAAKAEKCQELTRVDSTQSRIRFSHPELQRLNVELAQLETSYSNTQSNLFKGLCDKVSGLVEEILAAAQSLARLDVASSLGLLAAERGYCKPEILDDCNFKVVGGVHPVVAEQQLSTFISNDCSLEQEPLWIVTGPNMGGKSTFLRQNALISIMAQMGSFVPAESASLGVVDRLFARVGSSDNVSRHQSTFHCEMTETAHVLNNATPRSLIILDEIGRGTSHSEGLAIATAVVEHLHNKIGCRCLVSTHYHQLALLEREMEGVSCHRLLAKKGQEGIVFTYKIEKGFVAHSHGLEVASLCGVPHSVITRARHLQGSSHLEFPAELVALAREREVTERAEEEGSRGMNRSFTPEQQQVLKEIQELSLDQLTSLAALHLLHRLQEKLKI